MTHDELESALARREEQLRRCEQQRDGWEVAYAKIATERNEAIANLERELGKYWIWQGDGEDHLESLTCIVRIRPEALLQIITERDEAVAVCAKMRDALENAGWHKCGCPGHWKTLSDSCNIGRALGSDIGKQFLEDHKRLEANVIKWGPLVECYELENSQLKAEVERQKAELSSFQSERDQVVGKLEAQLAFSETEALKNQAACGELRYILEANHKSNCSIQDPAEPHCDCGYEQQLQHALSTDCGNALLEAHKVLESELAWLKSHGNPGGATVQKLHAALKQCVEALECSHATMSNWIANCNSKEARDMICKALAAAKALLEEDK